MARSISELSDSDQDSCAAPPRPPEAAREECCRKRRRSKSNVAGDVPVVDQCKRLRSILAKRCPCKRAQCRVPLCKGQAFDELLAHRVRYLELHKLDQDHLVPWHLGVSVASLKDCNQKSDCFRILLRFEVLHQIRDLALASEGKVAWKVVGRRVCLKTWKALHNLGGSAPEPFSRSRGLKVDRLSRATWPI